jgi:hypothetical protein
MPRQSKHDPDYIDALEKRAAKTNRALRRARAAQRDEARAEDTRRKIIAGALALEHFEKNPGSEFGKIMFRLLDEYTRPDSRYLFAFLPVRDPPPASPLPASDLSEAAE